MASYSREKLLLIPWHPGFCSDVRQSVRLLIYFVTGCLIICWALWSCDCDCRLGFVVVCWQSYICDHVTGSHIYYVGLCSHVAGSLIYMLGFVVM